MDIPTPDGIVSVDAYRLPPTFGLVLPILRDLRVAGIVDEFCPMKNGDHIRHGTIVEFLLLHYLQADEELPLYKLELWAGEHNVHLLFGREASEFNDDRIRRTLEAIYPVIEPIEQAVAQEAVRRYDIPVDALDWDLTHITFSGLYEGSTCVAAGYGDGQMHGKQIHISLYTTNPFGVPVMHKTLPGNAQQAPYANGFLKDLQGRLGRKQLLVLSDCAGITYETMEGHSRAGAYFLGPLATTPQEREQLHSVPMDSFVPLKYRSVRDPNCVHSCHDTTLLITRDKHEEPIEVRALFTHTTTRQAADSKERRKRIGKVISRLEQIAGYLNKGRYTKYDYALAQVQKATKGCEHLVAFTLTGCDRDLHLAFQVNEEAVAQEERFDGRRVLVTNVTDADVDFLYQTYKRHTTIEARFRNFKGDLQVNGIWLHTDERICALVATIIMALLVFTLIGVLSHRANLDTEYYHKMTPREVIFRFQAAILQVATLNGAICQTELSLTWEQCQILQELGLPNPARYLLLSHVQVPNWAVP